MIVRIHFKSGRFWETNNVLNIDTDIEYTSVTYSIFGGTQISTHKTSTIESISIVCEE